MYSIDREQLAQMIAAHTSGIKNAIAEPEDFRIADEAIELIEWRISS